MNKCKGFNGWLFGHVFDYFNQRVRDYESLTEIDDTMRGRFGITKTRVDKEFYPICKRCGVE